MSQIVIIGSSIAGISAAESAKKQNPDANVQVFSQDTKLPYYRLRIAEVLADESMAEKLYLHPENWYADKGITLNLGHTVQSIDVKAKTVHFEDNKTVQYDKLILAQGSHSFVPPIKGAHLKGVHTLWTMDDAMSITKAAQKGQSCVVIGGGLLGLETAYQIAKQGIETTIIETADRLLVRQLDEGGSAIFSKQVERQNVKPIVAGQVTEIKSDESGEIAKSVELAGGISIPADLVIISTGVRPNTQILDGTNIEIGRFVVVNDKMETSIPDVYAAGDLVEQDGKWYGQWSISKSQGTVAGQNAAGGEGTYTIQTPPYILNTMNTKVAAAGQLVGDGIEAYSEDVQTDDEALTYYKVCKSGDQIIGFALVGDTKEYTRLAKQMNS